jgi:chromosome segregation ATPase
LFFLGVENVLVSNKETSTKIAMSTMGVPAVTEVYMKAFTSMLEAVLEGLHNSTIVDPQCRKVIEAVHSLLPAGDDIAEVAAARTYLERLICISSDMQEAHRKVGSKSQKQDEARVLANQEQALIAGVLKTAEERMSSMEEQRVEKTTRLEALNTEVQELKTALHEIEEGVKELKSTQSRKQAEAKKLRDNLSESDASVAQELEVLQQKISAMGLEVGSIIEKMRKLGSPSC